MAVIDVTDQTFDSEVLKSDKPVVVDNWAPWCGPCRMFSPTIDEVSKEYGDKVKFVKVNVDDNPSVAGRFKVMSIPTVLLVEKGQLKAQSVGAIPKEALKKWIDQNL